jgi:hypothetical protein
MSQKKINGYVIFMKEVLGKGSYGSVAFIPYRFIVVSKTIPNFSAQSRSSKRSSVLSY